MSFNGSGTFQINSVGNPVVTGTTISSTWANALTADLATGLSTCITKDAQTTTTAKIPFAAGIDVTATASSFYAVTTFNATLTGCTTAPTYAAKLSIVGNVVTLTFPGTDSWTATSNASTKTLTGMPAGYRPSATIMFVGTAGDNGSAYIPAIIEILSTGVINLYPDALGSNWTGSGTAKGRLPSMSWSIA